MTTKKDKNFEVVRAKGKRKSDPMPNCSWCAGEWEGKYYAWTPQHEKSRERTIKIMQNDVAWYKKINKKNPTIKRTRANNQAKGDSKK